METTYRRLGILAVILILLIGSAQIALADAAPPQQPPAASVENGGFETHVQMVSEDVLLTVSQTEKPVSDRTIASNHIQGHVEATFWMKNQGEESESFDVWFPLGVEDGYFDVTVVDNFKAQVDGATAEIGHEELPGEYNDPVPWATWPATFPPGETVVLTVSYDLRPTGYMPYGEFVYILESGAGWWGKIGEGTVTVRFPYDVNEYNTPNYTVSPAMDDVRIDGTNIVWHFTDLEPTKSDNIRINVMAPSQWMDILAAQETAAENPDSADAYLALANAQAAGLDFDYGLQCCEALANAATANYQQALALGPDNVDAHISYLKLLLSIWFPYVEESYSADIPPTAAAALALDPENEELLNVLDQAVYTYLDAVDVNPDSEAMQAALEDMQSVLQAATEANPDNQGLLDINNELIGNPFRG